MDGRYFIVAPQTLKLSPEGKDKVDVGVVQVEHGVVGGRVNHPHVTSHPKMQLIVWNCELFRKILKSFLHERHFNSGLQFICVYLSPGIASGEAIRGALAKSTPLDWSFDALPERWHFPFLSSVPIGKCMPQLLLHVHHEKPVPGQEAIGAMRTARLTSTETGRGAMVVPHLLILTTLDRGLEGRH